MPDLLERLKLALSGRYTVESEIGRGGMATVYVAQDPKHRRQVAIKVLHPELAASLGTTRFLREIETVAGLDHPLVLPLYDSGEADGLLYFVMPYVEGESLRERLEREGQLPVDQALGIAAEVADGLEYLREEARLAATVGDTAGAVEAYRHYFALRDARPDLPTWAAQWDSMRVEYAALTGVESRR